MIHLNNLGQRLRNKREAAGLTQKELSEATGVGQSHISEIETGYATRKRLGQARQLAEYFGLEMEGPYYEMVPREG